MALLGSEPELEAPVVDPFATRSLAFKKPAGRPCKRPAASQAEPAQRQKQRSPNKGTGSEAKAEKPDKGKSSESRKL